MPQGHTDYSSTPLAKKLGIREGSLVHLVQQPDGLADRLEPLPGGVEFLARASKGLDVVVLFALREIDLRRRFRPLAAKIDPAGRLWVAWPKKTSTVDTDLDFGTVQTIGLDAGLVDNKSASITDVFQGLQFVYRLKDRPR
jgi:hypothetical protein